MVDIKKLITESQLQEVLDDLARNNWKINALLQKKEINGEKIYDYDGFELWTNKILKQKLDEVILIKIKPILRQNKINSILNDCF